uniref:aralkylamine N-acetyltransferase n=1 Tax=Nyssomyia neivai TaxID=330878 RepID=A0A1L8DBV7_9DIPT
MSDLNYRVAVAGDEEKVLNFIRKHYYPEEALTIGISPKEPTKEDEEFSLSCIPTGLSVVCEDSNKNIVGVLLCHEVDNSTLTERKISTESIEDPKWRTILTFLNYMEELTSICSRLNVTKGIQFSVLGVDPEQRGKSIGLKMMQKAAENALENKFMAIGSVCTSIFSARIAEKLGMECVASVPYSEWKNSEGKTIFSPTSAT